jgi:PAS domain S-box-containing protein
MRTPSQQLDTALLEQLVSTLQGVVILLDTDVRLALCNPYFENLTGYSAAEVLGQDWVDTFIPERERAKIREYFFEVLRDGMNDGHINPIVRKDGAERLIQWHSKTMDDSDGRIVGLLCTGYDVTEQTANALAVVEARNQAERANAGKSRFLAAASHDLRQPLQSLSLYRSALTRQLDRPGPFDSAKGKEITRKMRGSLDAMGDILDALLDISRLESGIVTPQKRDFRLAELLDRVVSSNLPQAEEKGLRLECIAEDCVVYSDPGLLERVIDNFVTNAIRYTEAGRVTIDRQTTDGMARILVSDTGVGF